MRRLGESGYSLMEVMAVMTIMAVVSVGAGVQSVYKSNSDSSAFRSDVKLVKLFLGKMSQRAYLSGHCTQLEIVDDKTIRATSFAESDPGCFGNLKTVVGDVITFQVENENTKLQQFYSEDGFFQAKLVFNKYGGTAMKNRKKVTISVSGKTGTNPMTLSILSAFGQILETSSSETVATH